MSFFTQGVATVKVWEWILVLAAVLVSTLLIMSYISTKMEERTSKKANQPAPNATVPSNPQLGVAPQQAAANQQTAAA